MEETFLSKAHDGRIKVCLSPQIPNRHTGAVDQAVRTIRKHLCVGSE